MSCKGKGYLLTHPKYLVKVGLVLQESNRF